MRIYYYKLTSFGDGAPVVQDKQLSLAICKPIIRRCAKPGDVVIGFAGKTLYPDCRILFAARVTKQLTNGDYFKLPQFANREDCIYGWNGLDYFVKPDAKHHGTIAQLTHDLGERTTYEDANVLLSNDYRYFNNGLVFNWQRRHPHLKSVFDRLTEGHRVWPPPPRAADHTQSVLHDLKAILGYLWNSKRGIIKNSGPSLKRCKE